MQTLQVQDVRLAFAERDILDNVSFTLTDKSRSALCGENGSGKSTLLKIVGGQMEADDISLVHPKEMRISYLPQSDIVFEGDTVYEEVEKGYKRFNLLLDEKRTLEDRLGRCGTEAEARPMLVRLHEIEESLLDSGYYDRQKTIYRILLGLGFGTGDFDRTCDEFSGGWQMRIALAKVLAEHPTIMLLDEPTNYLDIEARYWLRNYLKAYHGGVMIVSHDQAFLDDTVDEIYELFQGKLTRYSGNYSSYLIQREQEIARLEAAYKRDMEERKKTEQFIDRFRYKATKSKQVQSRIKQMEKRETVVVPGHLQHLHFSFPPAPHSGDDVIMVDHLAKRYGTQVVFDDFSMMVNRGDRLAVTGKNGAGKSTLLRMIAGVDADYQGTIRFGSGVSSGYFAQDTEKTLDPSNTVLEEVSSISETADLPKMRSYLGSFLFVGDDVFKSISVLSGGERSRLALLKILLHPANLLILDEPTNHLDINAKQMLLEALKQYDGTIVFVSHDSYFIEHIASRILYLTAEDPPEFFEGDYSYFSYKLEQKEAYEEDGTDKDAQRKNPGAKSYRDANRMRNKLTTLKRKSDELLEENQEVETALQTIEKQMALPENYSDAKKITDLLVQKKQLEAQRDDREDRWLALSEEIETMEASLA